MKSQFSLGYFNDTSVTKQVFYKFLSGLTYLRGLEIAELTEEDMPII
jgi:hypothetical protein